MSETASPDTTANRPINITTDDRFVGPNDHVYRVVKRYEASGGVRYAKLRYGNVSVPSWAQNVPDDYDPGADRNTMHKPISRLHGMVRDGGWEYIPKER